GDAQRVGDGCHSLMTGGTDGVEALASALHGATGAVERPAQALGAIEADRLVTGKSAGGRLALRKIPRRDAAQEVLMDDIGAVHQKKACIPVWARPRMSAWTSCVPS